MKLEMVAISEIKPDPKNPRSISRDEMEKLRRSIREFGLVQPFIVNSDGSLIGGHQRLEAVRAEGILKVPVVRLKLTQAKARMLNIALNKIQGDWDIEKLQQMVSELKDDEADLTVVGFSDDELLALEDPLGDELEPFGTDGKTSNGKESAPSVKIVVPCSQLPLFERALALTGKISRGEGLLEICRHYLMEHGEAEG